jgi:predicted helicase
MGKRDGGIDLIARKNDIYVLIQCKNWSKKKVTQKDIRVFVGDYYTYLQEHPELNDKQTKAYFYVSNELYEEGANKYQKDKDFLELKVLKMEEVEMV